MKSGTYDPADGFILNYGFAEDQKFAAGAAKFTYNEEAYPDGLSGYRWDAAAKKLAEKHTVSAVIDGDLLEIVTDCPDELEIEFHATPPPEPEPLGEEPTQQEIEKWKADMAAWHEAMEAWEKTKTVEKHTAKDGKIALKFSEAPKEGGGLGGGMLEIGDAPGDTQDYHIKVRGKNIVTAEGTGAVVVRDKEEIKLHEKARLRKQAEKEQQETENEEREEYNRLKEKYE